MVRIPAAGLEGGEIPEQLDRHERLDVLVALVARPNAVLLEKRQDSISVRGHNDDSD